MSTIKYRPRGRLFAALTLLASSGLFANEVSIETDADMVEDGRGGFILKDLVVRRQANVQNVKLEQDGSFTLLTSSPLDVYSALNSGVGAAVNFELSFARHSIVFTADGQQTINDIARALTLIGPETSFKVAVHRHANQDPSGRMNLTQSRAVTIVDKLAKNHRVNSQLRIAYEFKSRSISAKNKSSIDTDVLAVTVINLGAT